MSTSNIPNTRNHASCVASVAESGEGSVAFFMKATTMKDPAFLFYYKDFLLGTQHMTLEELGAYIKLLANQAEKYPAHLTEKDITRLVGNTWDGIKDKYTQDDNGAYYQKRLEREIVRRMEYSESRSKNRLGHMSNTSLTYGTELKSNELKLSNRLLSAIQTRNPGHRKPDLDKWAHHIDLMIRIDKRDPAEIEKVIDWCQADTFWQNNILSTEKLREQYDQLILKMGKVKPKVNCPKL